MKNINKNAVQALWADGKAFLTHKAIDNFSMGQGDFTIEVSFICNDMRDCLFYAQSQGFAFGIRNGLLYFELDGLGSITQKEDVAIVTDVLLSAAVSCREGKLSLYLEGLPIADQVETTSKATKNSGTYEIGKGLKGYIVELRLRSCGMTDQEILSDNGMGLSDCESIEFWSDFTSMQYRDKSHNALGLSTMQGSVKCVNVTSCTSLELHGGYVTMAKKSYGEAYSLLFKIYPQLESYTKMYVYSAVGADGTIFSIGVESDSEGDKQIFVENGGVVYHGNSALPLMAWTDIGLRVENGNAQLYIDGVRKLEFAFSGKLDNITSIIGVKPFEKKIVCKNGFWGYLDYFAEFDCALSEEKIAYYAEEQPYIFDESISSLYAFYCGDPIDLLTGNMLLSIGSGKAIFEKELNNLSAPIGMDLRVPQEVCAEWQELSEYEQWATTTAMDMVRDTYSQSMGFVMPEGVVPIEQTATKLIRLHFSEEIQEVKTVWTPENQDAKSNKFIGGSLSGGTGGVGVAVAGVVVMGGAGAAAAGGSAITKYMTMGIAAIGIVGGAIFIGEIVLQIKKKLEEDETKAKKKMPNNDDGDLQLISVCCNHDGNPETGSIHFHSDAELTMPGSMVYVNGDHLSIDLLLVTDRLAQGRVHVECVIENMTNETVSGDFTVKDNRVKEYDTFPGVIIPAREKVAVTVILPVRPSGEVAEYREDTWEFYFGEKAMCTCQANIYFQQNMPIEPWQCRQGTTYDPNYRYYPSLVFIKNMIFCKEQRTRKDLDNILNSLYDSKILKYQLMDTYSVGLKEFKLIQFNKDILAEKQNVNCSDCANIVVLIAAQMGNKMQTNLLVGLNMDSDGKYEPGFLTNPVMVIGYGKTWYEMSFSFHQVAFTSLAGKFSKEARIYDLTVKIDSGGYLSKSTGNKTPFLSGGYLAYETMDNYVVTEEPYDLEKKYYRERLVKSGQVAMFMCEGMDTYLYFDDVHKANAVSDKPYDEFKQRIVQFYRLDSEKYTIEIPQPEMNPSFLQEMRMENRSESQYECEWSAPDGMRVKWFRNAEHLPAGEYLASVLMRFSCRLTEKEAPEPGERVFYGPDLLITYFEGSAYAINCKDMEKAEEMAHNLKSSMIQ